MGEDLRAMEGFPGAVGLLDPEDAYAWGGIQLEQRSLGTGRALEPSHTSTEVLIDSFRGLFLPGPELG